MANVTLNKVIDDFKKLPLDEREYVIDYNKLIIPDGMSEVENRQLGTIMKL